MNFSHKRQIPPPMGGRYINNKINHYLTSIRANDMIDFARINGFGSPREEDGCSSSSLGGGGSGWLVLNIFTTLQQCTE